MTNTQTTIERSPVVAILGHVDHGKSTLLDTILKSNVVDGEAGGITQHLSAYEVSLPDDKRITFIDTPGHAAFDKMRHRGGTIADIAILIVSAEDGVKTQTKHAIEVIKKSKIPYIVAINKIDKPDANIERTKTELMEEGIYVEGYGGDIPVAEISAKHGQGVDDLLQTLLLVAEMEEMTGDTSKTATGFVIEAHRDPKQGISATLIIKNGSISKGQFVVVGDTITPTRMLRDFSNKDIEKAHFSTPIKLIGFNKLPPIGSTFETFDNKKDAEKAVCEYQEISRELAESRSLLQAPDGVALVPIILKTDVAGTAEAISGEIENLTTDEVIFKIIKAETGDINESDMQLALSDDNSVIIGFHVNEDQNIKGLNNYESTTIRRFDIIYKLTEYLEDLREERRIKKETETEQGSLKILKTFSRQKTRSVVGGSVISGTLSVNQECKVLRGDDVVGYGKIVGIQQGKTETKSVTDAGTECGILIDSDFALEERDTVISFIREIK
jgi:translation initiation factor IF-2